MTKQALIALTALWTCGVLAGCPGEPVPDDDWETKTIEAADQPEGDVEAGRDYLLMGDYSRCGPPRRVHDEVLGLGRPEQLLPDRGEANAELPYNETASTIDGQDIVIGNCLTCHARVHDGEVVIGLGDINRDFTKDFAVLAQLMSFAAQGEEEEAVMDRWISRVLATAPFSRMRTIGVNPANNVAAVLFAHRDAETLAWSDEPLLEEPPLDPVPTDVPPWWGLYKKNMLYYVGSGIGDHAHHMSTASALCVDDVDVAADIYENFKDVRAYLSSLRAPAYPRPLDEDLVDQGRAIFEQTCARCHGTYGDDWTYPNYVVSLDTVGTDPLLAEWSGASEDHLDWFNRSYYGSGSTEMVPNLGYVAPPLDGIWLTAPYLHNGSVPRLDQVLNSEARPTYWARSFASEDYLLDVPGWQHEELETGHAEIQNWSDRAPIYDTTWPGYGNQGHTFGDHLTDEERSAVIEYLKTL